MIMKDMMRRAKRWVFSAAFAAAGLPGVSASYTLVLQAGHDGAVTSLQWDERSGMVISAGEDRRLIVTDPRERRVLHRFRAAEGRILSIHPDPARNRAAVVSSHKGSYPVTVWDWSRQKPAFEYILDTEPLFAAWSAKGRYFIIGGLGDPSIIVLDGRTGRRLSNLRRLPSLYNAGYIGSTESILMTYTSSGAVRYWDIRSSALKLSTETETNLTDLHVLRIGDKSTVVARKNQTLFLINRQTGGILHALVMPGLSDFAVNPNNGRVDALLIAPAGASVRHLAVEKGRFIDADSNTPIETGRGPTAVARGGGSSYIATAGGELFVSGELGLRPLVKDRTWRPEAMTFGEESMFLSGSGELIRFTSRFFAADSPGRLDELNRIYRDSIPSGSGNSNTGLEYLTDGRLVLWNGNGGTRGGQRGIRVFNFDRPDETRFIESGGTVETLEIIDPRRLITVERSGSVKVIGIDDGRVLSSYSALGVLDAGYSKEGDFILAGRSNNRNSGTPLESIDAATRESVPVKDERFMVYRVISGPSSLYTIGVSRGSRDAETIIQAHDAKNPNRTRLVQRAEGEMMDGRLIAASPPGGSRRREILYTVLGGTVRRIEGNRTAAFQWRSPIRDIRLRGDVLYGLDEEGAAVLWNSRSGRVLLSVYFFEGGSWIASSPEGGRIWVSSSGVLDDVLLYRDGRRIDPRRLSGFSIISARG